MPTNDFLPFAASGGANVIPQAQYAALSALSNGFSAGIAPSQQLNKVWRQGTIMAAVLAQFIVDTSGASAVDDGTIATLLANLKLGIIASNAGFKASSITTVTASGTLGAVVGGGAVFINSASATAQTLPAASAVTAGKQVELMNINTGVATISRAGSDTITGNHTTVTSFALGDGDTLVLQSDGVSNWFAVGGSVQLGKAAAFGSLQAVNGYQKLPSGLIMQWGLTTAIPATSTGVTTLPITFPTAIFSVVATFSDAASPTDTVTTNVNGITTANFSLYNPRATAAQFQWFAIGN